MTVLCASTEMPRLDGLTVDYVDAMVGGGYRFENPNAGRSCGCGASFEEKNGPSGA
jgi:iron-sulfur cluster assembly protein